MEASDFGGSSRNRPLSNGLDFLMIDLDPFRRDDIAKECDVILEELTLLWVAIQPLCSGVQKLAGDA